MTELTRDRVLREIARATWDASRTDEGTISYIGANVVAEAVYAAVVEPLLAENERLHEADRQWREKWSATARPADGAA